VKSLLRAGRGPLSGAAKTGAFADAVEGAVLEKNVSAIDTTSGDLPSRQAQMFWDAASLHGARLGKNVFATSTAAALPTLGSAWVNARLHGSEFKASDAAQALISNSVQIASIPAFHESLSFAKTVSRIPMADRTSAATKVAEAPTELAERGRQETQFAVHEDTFSTTADKEVVVSSRVAKHATGPDGPILELRDLSQKDSVTSEQAGIAHVEQALAELKTRHPEAAGVFAVMEDPTQDNISFAERERRASIARQYQTNGAQLVDGTFALSGEQPGASTTGRLVWFDFGKGGLSKAQLNDAVPKIYAGHSAPDLPAETARDAVKGVMQNGEGNAELDRSHMITLSLADSSRGKRPYEETVERKEITAETADQIAMEEERRLQGWRAKVPQILDFLRANSVIETDEGQPTSLRQLAEQTLKARKALTEEFPSPRNIEDEANRIKALNPQLKEQLSMENSGSPDNTNAADLDKAIPPKTKIKVYDTEDKENTGALLERASNSALPQIGQYAKMFGVSDDALRQAQAEQQALPPPRPFFGNFLVDPKGLITEPQRQEIERLQAAMANRLKAASRDELKKQGDEQRGTLGEDN
jgi:hypothetical protein